MLRHYVPIKTLPLPTFRQILRTLRVEWRNSTLRFASLHKKHNLSRLQSHACATTGLKAYNPKYSSPSREKRRKKTNYQHMPICTDNASPSDIHASFDINGYNFPGTLSCTELLTCSGYYRITH